MQAERASRRRQRRRMGRDRGRCRGAHALVSAARDRRVIPRMVAAGRGQKGSDGDGIRRKFLLEIVPGMWFNRRPSRRALALRAAARGVSAVREVK
jgi:hypothetical protein